MCNPPPPPPPLSPISSQGSSFNNDLALFELDEPVLLSEDIMPICLERALFVDELLRGGRLGVVTGCGSLYEEGRAPLYLNEVSGSSVFNQSWPATA